ncbi:MAG: hypothetical protein BWX92_04031 [Deltaproteobacteria bacterium ADurb.Bin135]|nr:MAG: hypothetical protein BWX92_04031 [Deltaproteobacteria bacterium ADurb.Bin135]
MALTAAVDTRLSSLVDAVEPCSVRRGQFSITRIPTAMTTARMTATIKLRFETGISFNFSPFPICGFKSWVKQKRPIKSSIPVCTLMEGVNRKDIDGRSKDYMEQLMIISDRTDIWL